MHHDLDNVTTLMLSKATITQERLKDLYGLEIQDYATAHDMLAPPEEKNFGAGGCITPTR